LHLAYLPVRQAGRRFEFNYMHIAHLVCKFPPYRGGMGAVAFEEAARLSELGHEVTVFTLDQKEKLDPTKINFKIKYLKAFPRYGNGGFRWPGSVVAG